MKRVINKSIFKIKRIREIGINSNLTILIPLRRNADLIKFELIA